MIDLMKRRGNYLTHPRTIKDMGALLNKVTKVKDVDEKIHYLEVAIETLTRFPSMVGRGVKKYLQNAIRALKPSSKVPEDEFSININSAIKIVNSRIGKREKISNNINNFIKRRVGIYRNKNYKASYIFLEVMDDLIDKYGVDVGNRQCSKVFNIIKAGKTVKK